MITVLTFKWNTPGYRSTFLPEHVNTLQSMVSRNLHIPHKFVCITDDPEGLECEFFPLWDFPQIKTPSKKTNAFRCLKLFSNEAKSWFETEHILVLDLDIVIVNDITPLIDLSLDFKIWEDSHKNTHYNSSIWQHRLGTRTQVWDSFNPIISPRIIKQKEIMGSDQAWISYSLGPKEKTWSKTTDGIYSFRYDLKEGKIDLSRKENARIIVFHGKFNPWDKELQDSIPWIKKYYK